ncbi:poly-beta-hydroxybutyrate polymerase [Methylopila jiangsuensis]|uniref:Poly-beta-hydroxybutyrate polymerase n=2 Tax=Methylopila jiangsuensis TaxID=586230 RepID=A0A9W6JFQ6_9HYPH|nr:polyhydroxyalkanoate synthase [Methylopila jiangsuensis]GLK75194.1 poly-beta-hydroxybutyrate polymerase [Methylopila jiangsuensis]
MARNAAERSATDRMPAQPRPHDAHPESKAEAKPALRPVEVAAEAPAPAEDAPKPPSRKPARAKRAAATAAPRTPRAPRRPATGAKTETAPPPKAEPAAERPRAEAPPSPEEDSATTREAPFGAANVEAFAANMARLYEEGGKALSAYLRPRESGERPYGATNEIVDVVKTLGQVAERWMSDPARTVEAQTAFTGGFLDLWTNALRRFSGEDAPPTAAPDPKDGRFKDPEWTENPFFDFLKQAYLHTSRWAERMVDEAQDLDPHTRHKAGFYVRQISNAVSPSNFVPTNPELIRETLAQKGENLVRGMRMLTEDIAAGRGDLRIRQTMPGNFEVGKNLATTPGKVIFRNELMELIQYAPSTPKVRARPILIVPPWINKFYILDLTPEKSFIKWCVDQGLTVFCLSWVNPDARHARMGFDDYMRDGVLKAVEVATAASGEDSVDAIGYCVGGTLLAVTLAYLAAVGDARIASATFFTTQVDFSQAGDLQVFVDEAQIAAVEARMAQRGYLEGASMANAFNMLRPNDLIWPYVVNNYLKGQAPFPFDLLFWNSDATRMPAANHSFYLRGCYLNNDLAGGRMNVGGKTLDLSKVTAPIYNLATREDHIAPAKSAFLGATLFGGPVRFVLAGSGHIAGVVNHPAKNKYQHWVGGAPAGDLDDWLAKAEERKGSWWPDWRGWLADMDAREAEARIPGEGGFPAIEDAPGSYVKMRV